LAGQSSCVVFPPLQRGAQLSAVPQVPNVGWRYTPVFRSEELRCVSWRVICVANAGEPVNRMSETANTAGTLRNGRILSLHSLLSPDDVAQRRRPEVNDPTYCLRHSNRYARWIESPRRTALPGWFGNTTAGCELARQCRSCRLGEPSHDQPVKQIGFTIFIC
jgi:hypothetical protein